MRFVPTLVVLLVSHASWALAGADENLLAGGDFEERLAGWNEAWSRTPGVRAVLDKEQVHGGRQAVRIEHTGSQDWSFQQTDRRDAKPGDIYELSGWVRVQGEGDATLCVILYDAKNEVISWAFSGSTARASDDWRRLRSRFVVPPGAAAIRPRLIGNGPATVWLDDAVLRRVGALDEMRSADLPKTLTAANPSLEVTLSTTDGTLAVVDRRTGQKWTQRAERGAFILNAKPIENGFDLRLLESDGAMEVQATIRLDPQLPEVVVELAATGEMLTSLAFPAPFVTGPGTFLVMPVNEGISYPVDDESLKPMHSYLYGGHGLCMGWWGVTDGDRGLMAVVETPDDAAVRVPRVDGLLCLAPEWVPQKREFGPLRRIRYVFFDAGGYVAMCKRYREHSKNVGLFKTLAEKREANESVDLLVGAVNVWCWDRDPVGMCREMQSLGIRRVLWSHRSSPEDLREMNALGVLTSRYDIFQDTMNPANFPKLRGVHSDWTTEAWPDDLMLGPDGDWTRGWRVKGKDGEWYPCGALCDRQAVEYARRRVPPELQTHRYACRFIDTTTASPWRECYHPDHPMTRSESRHWKMELLRYMSEECGLVTGSETGHEAAVPYVHYFEGMLSLGPYRVPDSGRAMIEPWLEVPERVAKFQTGHFYRLPLWELVYHDCVVAQWYWGDYNNKLPALWDRRDLLGALYGTPPMFMFNRPIWEANRDRFVRSYETAAPVARATGYAEMLSHRWLTADHAVQETRFAGGVTVTVNFGDEPFTLPDGTVLAPLSHRVEGFESAPAQSG
ncbi:MAG TPA: glycoside hydrolase [Thermoguttaceae bacterium]|nr:glycoside hydrolase [Thermoguttaceae bacterium]